MASPILELLAKLGMDTNEYDEKLKASKEGAKGFASSFVSVMGKATKLGMAAFGAATTAVTAFGKEAISSYGEYEQLVGGVQKLYGNAGMSLEKYAESVGKTTDEARGEWQKLEDAQNQVLANAEDAFLTSGLSVNEYMETATGFSAALIKSLGGDSQKAAEITDIAMQAMSDNVNTFGTDAEAVQNAFMGLSRQNYMMIDNLKLGYAGTAEGMMELINDSGVLGKTLTDTSELANVGFDQMIMAIQKVQEQQGIAGTTAREALHTIEGSATATKKAWQNVITAIGKGEGLDKALNGLATALLGDENGGGLINNIIPRIQTVMEGVGDFISTAGPIITEKLPELFEAIFPPLFEASTSLLVALADSIPELITTLFPSLMEAAEDIIATLLEYLFENLPKVLESGANILNNLAQGIRDNLPELIATGLNIITAFLGEIIASLPDILGAGIEIIVALVEGIFEATPDILEAIGNIITDIWDAITNYDWLSLGRDIVEGIGRGISNFGGAIWNALSGAVGSAWEGIKNKLQINSPSRKARDEIGKFIPLGLAEGIDDEADSVYDAMENLADGTMDSFNPVIDDVFTERYEKSGTSDSVSIVDELKSLKDAILGMQVVLDTGATVGGIASEMDMQLGSYSIYKGRGN